jgi:hypothetical protein
MADVVKKKAGSGFGKVKSWSKKRKRDYLTPKSFDPFARNIGKIPMNRGM